jgi:thymidylate synthase (FAD)
MYLVKPSVEILTPIDAAAMMKRIEMAGRTCWKSEDKSKDGGSEAFIRAIMSKNHMSVIEHESISVRIICDRGVLAELSRHRLVSLSVESTRYCCYSEDKKGMKFIIPCWFKDMTEGEYTVDDYKEWYSKRAYSKLETEWIDAMLNAEVHYNEMLSLGAKPEQARSVLPNSLKTELVMTCNLREVCHILDLRTSRAAHPQIREIMIDLYDKLVRSGLGVFFEKIQPFRE